MSSLRARVKKNGAARAILFLAQNSCYAIESLFARPRTRNDAGPSEHLLAASIRVKDEARFLPEWLAHHHNLGVEHFFVYDNNSSDDTEAVVAPFVERGLVTYVPWPNVPASPSCEADLLARFGHRCSWVAFFDADEFLFETEPGALRKTLREYGHKPAIAINWRFFGSAGHESIPAGLVTERFDRAEAGCNHHVKVIARPAMIHRYRNSHNFYYRLGRLAVTPEGRRVFGSFVSPVPQPRLVLRHYFYRSREDYFRKVRAGFVDASGARQRARRLSVADRMFTVRNDVRVPEEPAVTRRTAEMLEGLGFPDEIHSDSGGPEPDVRSAAPDDRPARRP